MYKHNTIRHFTAGIMLMLFALSVTPKQLLHDTITGHKHIYSKQDGSVNFQASKNNFLCNWNNDVVESPFTEEPPLQLQQPSRIYASYFNNYILTYYSADFSFFSLRGPPSHA